LEYPETTAAITAKEAIAFPAVELFVERLAAAVGDFAFSDSDVSLVIEICKAVSGIPLALEFAAARVPAFGLAGVARNLRWPLRMLTNCQRTSSARHRSMHSSLEWSYSSLSAAEQRTLRRLSVFPGEFTLREATMVASDNMQDQMETADLVTTLASKSLVESDRSLLEPRFGLLTVTRAYALEKLVQSGELDALRQRHRFELDPSLAPHLQDAGPRNDMNGWSQDRAYSSSCVALESA
jgi:predicted ATPase